MEHTENVNKPAGAPSALNVELAVLRGSHLVENWRHDAGAYARCSYCGRYSDAPESLSHDEWPCDCGKLHGWSGSFKRPTEESLWSEAKETANAD